MHCHFIIIVIIAVIIYAGRWPILLFIYVERGPALYSGDDPLSVPYAWVGIYIHMDVFYEAYLYLHTAIYAECL